MDKNAIKKYAVWAREELIERVSQKAYQYEISADADPNADSAHGVLLNPLEKKQRVSLINKVKDKGMDQVIEEVAYTWFNRFAALRFMEVNNYLPSRVRVFTDEEGAFKPEILTEAIHLELKGLDMEKVYALKEANDDEALFKYLIIAQCNALSSVLPGMFQKIADYTELLFPDNLLREGSVVEQMVTQIPEDNWKDQVQIIGWLYQYYNTEPKDKVFADLKKNKKITKDKIPAATQLFTPDWIVRYMVENSLGRLWIEGHPNTTKKSEWKYYLEEAEQEPEVQKQLYEIRKEYASLKPEDIRVIDLCSGSGHICAYLFDVLMQIYEDYGIQSREAVRSIIENNLWGLDIDDRAAQLAYFSVMMKAVQYDNRFLRRKDENGNPDIPQPHVYAIRESNHLNSFAVEQFVNGDAGLKKDMATLIDELHDAKEYGSILNVSQLNFDALYKRFDECKTEISMYQNIIEQDLYPFVQVARALAQKYDVVVTNPPYMGSSGMDAKLSQYMKENYPDSKSDLFAVFIERCGQMTAQNRYQAMITQHAWMFLSSFEKLRDKLLQMDTVNMAHLGSRAFDEIGGEVVQTTSFVLRKSHVKDYKGVYCRLIDPTTQQGKEDMFLADENRYESAQDNFSKIPGSPIAYWLSPAFISAFQSNKLGEMAEVITGMTTGNNNEFLRLWFEVDRNKEAIGYSRMDDIDFDKMKWIPYSKGGNRRNFYGNGDYVVNWTRKNEFNRSKTTLQHLYLRKALTWPFISSGKFSARYLPEGYLWDVAGSPCFFESDERLYYTLGFLCSKVADFALKIMNPTINVQAIDLAKLPLIIDNSVENKVCEIVKDSIGIARDDWDSNEVSWDFKFNYIAKCKDCISIENRYSEWKSLCNNRYIQIKNDEEELNRIFADIYGLGNEISSEISDEDVTVAKADINRDIRSFISYAVGCMLGRYSLDVDGLAYAGGDWDDSKYRTFIPDKDAIIPITDDEYFTDDIVGRFVDFIRTVYGEDTLEENLKFIADALGEKGATSREVIRNYFLNDFYKDHCKIYQKRPIYWLFDSGKKNGFKCLIYMHRYQPDTIARIRTDYVHEQQARYRTAISGLERQISGASTSDRVRLNKQLEKLKDQAEETRLYEEKIHHLADQMISIDLDDGVKHNYAIFQDVLAKIK